MDISSDSSAPHERRSDFVPTLWRRQYDRGAPVRVDQWTPALHKGDAIGDSARLMRDAFRSWGHTADVYALELDEERERRLLDLLELRRPRLRPRTVLLRVAALRAGHREVEGGGRSPIGTRG